LIVYRHCPGHQKPKTSGGTFKLLELNKLGVTAEEIFDELSEIKILRCFEI